MALMSRLSTSIVIADPELVVLANRPLRQEGAHEHERERREAFIAATVTGELNLPEPASADGEHDANYSPADWKLPRLCASGDRPAF